MRGLLVAAVLCLAVGVGVLFEFCHGTTGFSFGYPISATSFHIDLTTTGAAAIVGLGLSVVGAFLLLIATIIALVGMFGRRDDKAPVKRRDTAFEE